MDNVDAILTTERQRQDDLASQVHGRPRPLAGSQP
jgi:hypothetical protein